MADILIGHGMSDKISPQLLSACQNLMNEKAESADQVCAILVDKLMLGDAAVQGMINKIKGQIGEDIFAETAAQAGFMARLADSGSQEAWDVAVTSADGATQYIQVKTMSSADSVLQHMQLVADKLASGEITDGNNIVTEIGFAVPQDIYGEVVSKALAAELEIPVMTFDITAQDAARIVQDGFDNVAYLGLGNFFNQLAGGTLTALAIHTLVQMYLLRKGACEAENMMNRVAMETASSAGGIGAAIGMEAFISKGFGVATGSMASIAVVVATGLTIRGLLRRMIIERDDLSGFLQQENNLLKQRSSQYLLSVNSSSA